MCFASGVSTMLEIWFFSKLKIAFDKSSRTSFLDTFENLLKDILLSFANFIISSTLYEITLFLNFLAFSILLKLNCIKSLFSESRKKLLLLL